MAIYKFRVFYEEDDNIYRDIEMKPVQTFFDLQQGIIKSYNLADESQSYLFQSNDNWKKGKAMPLQNPHQKKGNELAVLQVGNYIDDPHQHFIFEFNGKQEFVFLIELLSLLPTDDKKKEYPFISRSVGPSPFKKDDLLKHLDSKSKTIDEEYGVDHEDDDMDEMGNEGDEEEKDEASESDAEQMEESSNDEFDF